MMSRRIHLKLQCACFNKNTCNTIISTSKLSDKLNANVTLIVTKVELIANIQSNCGHDTNCARTVQMKKHNSNCEHDISCPNYCRCDGNVYYIVRAPKEYLLHWKPCYQNSVLATNMTTLAIRDVKHIDNKTYAHRCVEFSTRPESVFRRISQHTKKTQKIRQT